MPQPPANPASLRPNLQAPSVERRTSDVDASARHGRSSTLAWAGFQRRQFLSIESGTEIREYLRFGSPRQDQFGSLAGKWDIESRGGRVEADRSVQVVIPEVGSVDSGGP